MKKRILSIILVLCIAFTLFPLSAFAEGEILLTNNNIATYRSITEGGTYKLSEDITVTAQSSDFITVAGGTAENPVILDLNGYILKHENTDWHYFAIKVQSGNLIIKDSAPERTHSDSSLPVGGVVTVSKETVGSGNCGGGVFIGEGSIVTLQSGTVVANIFVGHVNIGKGGLFNAQGGKIIGFGNGNVPTAVSSDNGGTLNVPNDSTTVFDGLLVTDEDSGENVISGGTFNYGGMFYKGEIKGGVFNTAGNSNIIAGNVNISGGIFNCNVMCFSPNKCVISGGTFSGKISYDVEINCGIFYGEVNDSNIKGTPVYKVSFDINGGESTVPATQVFVNVADAKVSKPADPAKDGCEFKGWYSDKDCTSKYNFENAVSSNMILYAGWEDTQAPVITGLEDYKIYCGEVKFKVADNVGVESVKFGDKTLTADSKGYYTLEAGSGFGMVVAKDAQGNASYCCVRVNSDHVCNWKNDGTYYWKKCDNCDYETTKKQIPTASIVISGDNAVCRTNDYVFTFTVPSDFDAVNGYIESVNSSLGEETDVDIDDENGIVTVTVPASSYNGVDKFKSVAIVILEDGYPIVQYGNWVDVKHTGTIEHVEAKVATKDKPGNIEYWYCSDCGVCYADKELTNEVTEGEIYFEYVEAPKTGDNGNVITFMALFVVSGGLISIMFCKAKNNSVKQK